MALTPKTITVLWSNNLDITRIHAGTCNSSIKTTGWTGVMRNRWCLSRQRLRSIVVIYPPSWLSLFYPQWGMVSYAQFWCQTSGNHGGVPSRKFCTEQMFGLVLVSMNTLDCVSRVSNLLKTLWIIRISMKHYQIRTKHTFNSNSF